MKKVLITGGVGTVGTAFFKKYYDLFEFYSYSRNEAQIVELKRSYPKVNCIIGDILNLDNMTNVFERVKPDLVIHAAALKHVNLAEKNLSRTIEINVIGSLNVVRASVRAKVPVTIGISTDKACSPTSVYGYSKRLMELLFKEHFNDTTKFVCSRFANVASSNGSVIPFWKQLAEKGEPLKLTDERMNRLMFSGDDAAELIFEAYQYSLKATKPFVLSSIMKSVKMLDLAKSMHDHYQIKEDIKIVGLRPGEKLNETLVSTEELNDAFLTDNDKYIMLYSEEFGNRKLSGELNSETAEFMNAEELRGLYVK